MKKTEEEIRDEIMEEIENEHEEEMAIFMGRCVYVLMKHGVETSEIAKEFRTDESRIEEVLDQYLNMKL